MAGMIKINVTVETLTLERNGSSTRAMSTVAQIPTAKPMRRLRTTPLSHCIPRRRVVGAKEEIIKTPRAL
jgi:hypothetical protein